MKPERNSSVSLLKEGKLILYSAIIAFLGFIDATYLTIVHYKNVIPPCTIGSCETVLTSKYAEIFGVPTALLGSLFYIFIIVLCVLILTSYRNLFLKLFYILAAWGFIFSMYLLALQAFVLHSFCQYCLLSVATSAGIATLAFLDHRSRKALTK